MIKSAKIGDKTYQELDASSLDIRHIQGDEYHLILDNLSYQITLIGINGKHVSLSIDGRKYDVSLRDSVDELIDQLGFDVSQKEENTQVIAPMPGLILDVTVSSGDQISTGDTLVILEAMKMENVLKSTRDGTVKQVNVAKGDSVDKSQLLIEFE